MAIIYMAVNMVNNKCYIGKTVKSLKKRASDHISDSKRGSGLYFHNAIRKYGKNSFEWDIIETVSNEDAYAEEHFWIAYYKSIGLELYNLTDGGCGTLGLKMSDETKKKISLTKLGNITSEETKLKLSIALKGRIVSQTTKDKISKAQTNRKTYYGFVSPTGVIQEPIIHLGNFCKEHNLSQSAMISVYYSNRKRHKGWTISKKSN